MSGLLTHWLDGSPTWLLYTLVALTAFVESLPALGLLFPGHTILFFASFVSAGGLLNPYWLATLIITCGLAGDILAYGMGHHWGPAPLRRLPWKLRLTENGEKRLGTLLATHGKKSIFFARFQPVGRAFGPYVAGAIRMRFLDFFIADFAAGFAAAVSLVALGYLSGLGYERLSKVLGVVLGAITLIVLAVVIYVGLRIRDKRSEKETL